MNKLKSNLTNTKAYPAPALGEMPARYLWFHGRRLLFELIRWICLTAVHLFIKLEEHASLLFNEYRQYSGITLAGNLHATNHRLHALVSGEEPFAVHPVVSILGCLDGGIDYKRAVGWMTNGHIDVTRVAGSAFEPGVIENLAFLTSRHPIKLHIVTRHTSCAAEDLACRPEEARFFPHLWSGVAEREHYFRAFLAQPEILEKLHKQVAVRFLDSLGELPKLRLGITRDREAAIRTGTQAAPGAELVILPMVVDKRTKIFFVDTKSFLFPILLAIYPGEIQAMVDADQRIARKLGLDLEEVLAIRNFSQPETCGCQSSNRQVRRTQCVMLGGAPARSAHSALPQGH